MCICRTPIRNILKKETVCFGMFGQAKASFLVSNLGSGSV
jgi:hypothetical protein